MATFYRRFHRTSSTRKHGAAPHNTRISGDTPPSSGGGSERLLDRFRDKMRSLFGRERRHPTVQYPPQMQHHRVAKRMSRPYIVY